MGIFSRIKTGISSKANAALDKAINPEKELEIAIAELEERRAMVAIKAGDDEAARLALREKKAAETEAAKIERDKHEAASYAIQLNKSRKEFETKLSMLKMRKGTLATQLAVARAPGGDAFGHDSSVWDRFKDAEDRIDSEVIASEVDAAMRGEDAMEAGEIDRKLAAITGPSGLLGSPDGADDPLARLKEKMAEQKAALDRFVESASSDFLAVATPGAGKTTFALTAARRFRFQSA